MQININIDTNSRKVKGIKNLTKGLWRSSMGYLFLVPFGYPMNIAGYWINCLMIENDFLNPTSDGWVDEEFTLVAHNPVITITDRNKNDC